MMFNKKSRVILFLCAVLILSFVFGGCSVKEDSEESKALCEAMLHHLIADDYESAYKMVEGDTVRCRKQKVRTCLWFGLGLLVASVLPTEWVLCVAAAALVLVSLSCARR